MQRRKTGINFVGELNKEKLLKGTSVLLAGRTEAYYFTTTKCSLKERCQLGMTTVSKGMPVALMVRKGWPHLRSLNAALVTKTVSLCTLKLTDLLLDMVFCRIIKFKERGLLQLLARRFYPRDGSACMLWGAYEPLPVNCVKTALYLFVAGVVVSTGIVFFEKAVHCRTN